MEIGPRGEHGDDTGIDHVEVARCVVRQHHPVGVPAATHLHHGVGPRLERGVHVQAEAIHAQDETVVGQRAEVVDVGAVARVTQHHPGGVDALLVAQQLLHDQAGLRARMGVHGDRGAGGAVGPGHRSHDAGHPVGEPLVVDGTLQEGGLDPGAGDAFGDVGREHLDHRIRHVRPERGVHRRIAVVEEERHLVVGVTTGGDDDVQVGDLLGDALDARDVPAQPDDGGIHDGTSALGRQRAQLVHGVDYPFVFAAPLGRVVLLDVGIEDEHVLVHVGPAEVGGVHRATNRLNGRHSARSLLSAGQTLLVGRTTRRSERLGVRGRPLDDQHLHARKSLCRACTVTGHE